MCAVSQCGLDVQFIVADNNSRDNTKDVVESFSSRLPLEYCFESKPGKNAALNRAIDLADGDVLLFTDDDVLVQPDWLHQWEAGVARWPEQNIFGGPIHPEWPSPVPRQIRELPFRFNAYCILSLEQNEGPFEVGRPWGANLGIRRRALEEHGFRFCEAVGPSQGQYVMGSESELLQRLEAVGHRPVYLPSAGVRHILRPEQLTPRWLCGRAFRYGRSRQYFADYSRLPQLFGVPRYLYKMLGQNLLQHVICLLSGDRVRKLQCRVDYWILRGQIFQSRLDSGAEHQDLTRSAARVVGE